MAELDRQQVSKTVRSFLEKIKPPAHIRPKLDYGFHFYRQNVELFAIRPKFKKPGKAEHAFAKATYDQSRRIWRVYWMRGNLKWHPYEPSSVETLEGFLDLVKSDRDHCFFG